MSARPALIFDFGNVIAHFDFTRSCERFGRPLGLSGIDFLAKAKAAGFVDLLSEYETGKMTSQDFHQRVCDLTGIDVRFEDFATDWGDIFSSNSSVHDLIADLKSQGYALFLGSNTNELHYRHFSRQFKDVLRHFDQLVLSYEVRHIKPNAGFFQACAAAACRPAKECVFIDDVEENVEGARLAGLIGLLYRDTPGLVEELGKIGVEVSRSLDTRDW